ncbi:MAG: hypothetical protein ACSHYC_10195 [Alphaproteobacteria bacterium]
MSLRDLDTPRGCLDAEIAEHDIIDVSKAHKRPSVGDKVRLFQPHACPASNLFDAVFSNPWPTGYRHVEIGRAG